MATVTLEQIEKRIVKKEFYRHGNTTLTICILTLDNGFTVTGESACVDPANFSAEIGEQIAYENAREKIWALEGYLLIEKMMEPVENRTLSFGEAIEILKLGKKVARQGWNGKGIFIELQVPDKNSKMTSPYIFIDTTGLQTENAQAPKSRVPWLASQTDMLATDWVCVC